MIGHNVRSVRKHCGGTSLELSFAGAVRRCPALFPLRLRTRGRADVDTDTAPSVDLARVDQEMRVAATDVDDRLELDLAEDGAAPPAADPVHRPAPCRPLPHRTSRSISEPNVRRPVSKSPKRCRASPWPPDGQINKSPLGLSVPHIDDGLPTGYRSCAHARSEIVGLRAKVSRQRQQADTGSRMWRGRLIYNGVLLAAFVAKLSGVGHLRRHDRPGGRSQPRGADTLIGATVSQSRGPGDREGGVAE